MTKPPSNPNAEQRGGHSPGQPAWVAPAAQASSVLSTMNDDGSRRWLKPRVSPGRFLSARRAVAYLLIAIFAALPLIKIGDRPLILLDIAARKFSILGGVFYPTDTLLMAILLVSVFLTIFWLTALLGRVWCGWACPQTVYMEFLFRPIERLLEGAPGRTAGGLIASKPVARAIKIVVYFVCSVGLAHLFLAYFVPWDQLRHWVLGSPTRHPIGFAVVMAVTVGMMLDFGFFREQICVVACPYGRMQSVMLDRHSMTVRYDVARGEPRGKKRTSDLALPVVEGGSRIGDCIDCMKCVTTCPTGIDIRNGLQMECIGCAQCIDACDDVMERIGRPQGLIRYSSKAVMEGEPFRPVRPRVILYPLVIIALSALFVVVLMRTGVADVTVLRGLGQPFTALADGTVRNNVRLKISNRLDTPALFTVDITGIEGATLKSDAPAINVPPGQMVTVPIEVDAPASSFRAGKAPGMFVISGPEKYSVRRPFTLVGPQNNSNGANP